MALETVSVAVLEEYLWVGAGLGALVCMGVSSSLSEIERAGVVGRIGTILEAKAGHERIEFLQDFVHLMNDLKFCCI